MHIQARYFIRTALIFLVVAFCVGALVLINQGLALDARIGTLLPVFYHLLMVGWATQLICGVALWMFPSFSREQPRGDERLGWFTYVALNTGVVLAALHDPLAAAIGEAMIMHLMLVGAGVLYILAIGAFAAHAVPRIVPFRALPRPDQAPPGQNH
jgi:hypothetical protein